MSDVPEASVVEIPAAPSGPVEAPVPEHAATPTTLADAKAHARERLATFAQSPPGTAPPAATAQEPAPWEGKTAEDLWKDNEKLAQLAQRAEAWAPFEQNLARMHPEDVTFLLGAMDALSRGDKAALSKYAPGLRHVLESASKPVTQADLRRALSDADHRNAVRRHERDIDAHMTKLAAEHSLTGDERLAVLQEAMNGATDTHPLDRLSLAARRLASNRHPKPAPTRRSPVPPKTLPEASKSARDRVRRIMDEALEKAVNK